MIKERKYPIKYAVLELKERGGWSCNYAYITQGFIVSKCYVVESNIVYHSDGSNSITHKVVFPFEDISCFKNSLRYGRSNIGDKQVPSYDACDRPYPINIVDELFDSYEESKKVAEDKNEEYRCNLVMEVSVLQPDWKEQFEELKKDFDKRLDVCYLFEELVSKKTTDMEISDQLVNEDDKQVVRVLKSNVI